MNMPKQIKLELNLDDISSAAEFLSDNNYLETDSIIISNKERFVNLIVHQINWLYLENVSKYNKDPSPSGDWIKYLDSAGFTLTSSLEGYTDSDELVMQIDITVSPNFNTESKIKTLSAEKLVNLLNKKGKSYKYIMEDKK